MPAFPVTLIPFTGGTIHFFVFALAPPPAPGATVRLHVSGVPVSVWCVLVLNLSVVAFLSYRAFRLVRPKRPRRLPPEQKPPES